MSTHTDSTWLDDINWNTDGLVPAIAQEAQTGRVLTLAWMNRDALFQTIQTGKAIYWSRSRNTLWQKGESSGHYQEIQDIYLDCDNDCILLKVRQAGGIACHTGRRSCFYQHYDNGKWVISDPVIKDPALIYK